MKKKQTNIEGLFIIENIKHLDQRGSFMESWNKKGFTKEDLNADFSQDNISISKKNVIRGLHFQKEPHEQIKYIKVIRGRILDIAVDIRKKSKTFGQYFSIELSDSNNLGLWIPCGFAHGFLSLENNTIVSYKCTGEYKPNYETTINWNDSDIGIEWGVKNPIISKKDTNGISIQEYKKYN